MVLTTFKSSSSSIKKKGKTRRRGGEGASDLVLDQDLLQSSAFVSYPFGMERMYICRHHGGNLKPRNRVGRGKGRKKTKHKRQEIGRTQKKGEVGRMMEG